MLLYDVIWRWHKTPTSIALRSAARLTAVQPQRLARPPPAIRSKCCVLLTSCQYLAQAPSQPMPGEQREDCVSPWLPATSLRCIAVTSRQGALYKPTTAFLDITLSPHTHFG